MGTYDLSGRLSVGFADADPGLVALLAAQMDPLSASPDARPPDVELGPGRSSRPPLVDIQNPARDGVVTASDGRRLLILQDGLACALPDPLAERPAAFVYEPGFPIGRIFARVVRPALQLALHRHAAVAVHAAAVELDGRAVLVAGWSETGKTETALALMESGARFISDKWTILGIDGAASTFPIGVGVRRWVLPYLPTLAAALPAPARRRMRVAALAAVAARPAQRGSRRAAAVAGRALAMADRAGLTPSEVRRAYGQDDDPARRVPLGATAVLTTVPGPGVSCAPADHEWAAARLARSAAYERRELFALFERRRYALPDAGGTALETAVAAEARLLQDGLRHERTLDVRAPFPTDPRAVAAAITRAL
jgi:hypothetical protein